jgi:hypothetical protein
MERSEQAPDARPTPPRYALYYAPAVGSAWWRFGCSWLGRDAASGDVRVPPAMPALAGVDLLQLTAAPRRYGFHATLVAPFTLAPGVTPAQLHQRIAELARTLAPVPLGALQPAPLEGFVALLPQAAPPTAASPNAASLTTVSTKAASSIDALARTCVLALDPLRATLSPAEFARRTRGQDALGVWLVQQHGYALVMDRFRFHMTLTGDVDAATAKRVVDAACALVAPLNKAHPPLLDRLCLYVEPGAGTPWRRVADFELAR